MPQVKLVNKNFTFSDGYITDTSGLNSSHNLIKEGSNVDIPSDGSTRRRQGVDYESGYSLFSDTFTDEDISDKAFNVFRWPSMGGDPTFEGIGLQIGTDLYIYKYRATSVSANLAATVDLSSFVLSGQQTNAERTRMDFASGQGFLFVAGLYSEPVVLTYDPDTEQTTVQETTIRIRDFDGVDDGLSLEEKPSTLSDNHQYNLFNQGWAGNNVTGTGTSGGYSGGGGNFTTVSTQIK